MFFGTGYHRPVLSYADSAHYLRICKKSLKKKEMSAIFEKKLIEKAKPENSSPHENK